MGEREREREREGGREGRRERERVRGEKESSPHMLKWLSPDSDYLGTQNPKINIHHPLGFEQPPTISADKANIHLHYRTVSQVQLASLFRRQRALFSLSAGLLLSKF